jgi:aquaporin related protein
MSVSFAPDFAPGGGNSNQTVVFIALSYGFSLLIAAWVLYRVSGGLFNPAVTLGMVITGTLPPIRGLVLFPVQILGAICAAAVVSCIIPSDIAIVQTTLAPNMSVARGIFLEMVGDCPHNHHLQNYDANFCSASS